MLEHQKPFESLPDYLGGYLIDEPGFRVALSGARFLLLQGRSESALQDALASELGLELPAPQGASIRGDYAVLWLTPSEWLLEAPEKENGFLESALTRRLLASLAAVTDVSDAFGCCEVSGARGVEVLMSGCSLDLNPCAFPVGRVARTALADIPIILCNPGESLRFRCLVDRSFVGHFRDWLLDMTQAQRSRPRHHLITTR